MHCPFCQIPPERILAQNEHAFAIHDAFPVSPGHTLIIPRRHVGSFFETTQEEKLALIELLDVVGARQQPASAPLSQRGLPSAPLSQHSLPERSRREPDAYNIGINDGPAAGQTVPHLHIHLIPRYEGDVPDPRGGVRWVVPEKARYWE